MSQEAGSGKIANVEKNKKSKDCLVLIFHEGYFAEMVNCSILCVDLGKQLVDALVAQRIEHLSSEQGIGSSILPERAKLFFLTWRSGRGLEE